MKLLKLLFIIQSLWVINAFGYCFKVVNHSGKNIGGAWINLNAASDCQNIRLWTDSGTQWQECKNSPCDGRCFDPNIQIIIDGTMHYFTINDIEICRDVGIVIDKGFIFANGSIFKY